MIEYLTVREYAELMKLTKHTVYLLVKRKEIKHERLGKTIRIPMEKKEVSK